MRLKNIADLTVTQIRIFPVDVIPLGIITTKSCVEKIRDALSIGEIETRPFIEGKHIITFRRGELKNEKGIIAINKVEVEPRRIIIEVEGTDKELTSQQAASIEQLTRRPGYDKRVFQDGIYIIEKDGKRIK